LFGSRIDLCRDFTKSSYIGTFRKIGNPSSHQVCPCLCARTSWSQPCVR
jgi:hypothetical protein